VRVRGDGVKGMRPPAVRVEKSPVWDLIGVDTAVAILQYQGMISVERQINVSIDDGSRFGISNKLQETQPNGSWQLFWVSIIRVFARYIEKFFYIRMA
jgi:hypothetical protein